MSPEHNRAIEELDKALAQCDIALAEVHKLLDVYTGNEKQHVYTAQHHVASGGASMKESIAMVLLAAHQAAKR